MKLSRKLCRRQAGLLSEDAGCHAKATAARPFGGASDDTAVGGAVSLSRPAAVPPIAGAYEALHEETAPGSCTGGLSTLRRRDIRKFEKKAREIQRLQQRIADGEALKPNQLERLAKAGGVQRRLAELLALHAREPQAEALATEAEERPIGSNGSPVRARHTAPNATRAAGHLGAGLASTCTARMPHFRRPFWE